MSEKDETQLLVKLDKELVKRFKKRLIDDELSFKAWLEQRIKDYLKESHARRSIR